MKMPYKRYIVTDGTVALMPEKRDQYSIHGKNNVYVQENAYKTERGAENFMHKVNRLYGGGTPELHVEEITVMLEM